MSIRHYSRVIRRPGSRRTPARGRRTCRTRRPPPRGRPGPRDWVAEGREQGLEQREQGLEQGLEQGRAEERALLCRLAARKFDADAGGGWAAASSSRAARNPSKRTEFPLRRRREPGLRVPAPQAFERSADQGRRSAAPHVGVRPERTPKTLSSLSSTLFPGPSRRWHVTPGPLLTSADAGADLTPSAAGAAPGLLSLDSSASSASPAPTAIGRVASQPPKERPQDDPEQGRPGGRRLRGAPQPVPLRPRRPHRRTRPVESAAEGRGTMARSPGFEATARETVRAARPSP